MGESETQRLRRENVLQYKRIAELEAEVKRLHGLYYRTDDELAALKAQFADLLDELRELRTAEPSMYKGMGITKAIRVIESWGART